MSIERSPRRARLPLGWMTAVVCAFGAGAALSAALLSQGRSRAATLEPKAGDPPGVACRASFAMAALGRAASIPVGEAGRAEVGIEIGAAAAPEPTRVDDAVSASESESATPGAYFATAAAVHAADSIDADWSRRGEDEIGQLVATRAPDFSVDRIDCRTRTCSAQLRPAGPAATATALEDLVNGASSNFSEISVDVQPSGALTLYLARAGAPNI